MTTCPPMNRPGERQAPHVGLLVVRCCGCGSNAQSTAGLQPRVSQLRTQPILCSPGTAHRFLGLAEGQVGWKQGPLSLSVSRCHQVSAALPSLVLQQLLLAMDATTSWVSRERRPPKPEHLAPSRSCPSSPPPTHAHPMLAREFSEEHLEMRSSDSFPNDCVWLLLLNPCGGLWERAAVLQSSRLQVLLRW